MVERKRKGEREREDYFVWKEGINDIVKVCHLKVF